MKLTGALQVCITGDRAAGGEGDFVQRGELLDGRCLGRVGPDGEACRELAVTCAGGADRLVRALALREDASESAHDDAVARVELVVWAYMCWR